MIQSLIEPFVVMLKQPKIKKGFSLTCSVARCAVEGHADQVAVNMEVFFRKSRNASQEERTLSRLL